MKISWILILIQDIDDDDLLIEEESLEFLIAFKDFEDVIMLSNRGGLDELITVLHNYENKYYLYTEFPEDVFEEDEIDDILSILLEYGYETQLTIHRIQEYGKEIISKDVFAEIRKYFK